MAMFTDGYPRASVMLTLQIYLLRLLLRVAMLVVSEVTRIILIISTDLGSSSIPSILVSLESLHFLFDHFAFSTKNQHLI